MINSIGQQERLVNKAAYQGTGAPIARVPAYPGGDTSQHLAPRQVPAAIDAASDRLVTNPASARLCLLGGPFVINNGRRHEIPEGSQRLLVFVTLNGGRASRRNAAGTLWPFGNDERAAGNLRSALWRLHGAGIHLLHSDKCLLYLDPQVSVDIIELSRWATSVIDGSADDSDLLTLYINPEALTLLPGWYDDWVILERERLRQRLLHAMESFVRRLITHGLFADAVDVALTAVGVEPLRESAQRALIEAYLAEGNLVEARRAYAAYSKLLAVELGAPPSYELTEIVRANCVQSRAKHLRSGDATFY